MQKPTYIVQGHEFTLKPTTIRNRRAVTSYLSESTKRLAETDTENIEDIGDLIERFDEFRMFFDIFRIVTDGPHDKIDFEDFDVKLGEVALADFFPTATVMTLRQIGFLDM